MGDKELQELFHELELMREMVRKNPSPTTRWKVRKLERAIRDKGAVPPHEKASNVPNVSLKVKEIAVKESVSPRMVKENVGVEVVDVGGGGRGVGIRALVARFQSFQAAAQSPSKTPPRKGIERQESMNSPRGVLRGSRMTENIPVNERVMDGLYFGEEEVGLEGVLGKFVPISSPMVEFVEEEDCSWVFKEKRHSSGGHMSLRFPEPLKTTSQKTSKQGIKSGKRSAIFRHEGACYRLKGCKKAEESEKKDEDQNQENIPDGNEGSTCRDFCFRELFMTSIVEKELKKSGRGIRCANQPVGFFCYDEEESGCPKNPKYCSVFQTIGDKRAGKDLLFGLEQLYDIMIPTSYDPDDLIDLFELERIEGCEISPTWLACAACSQKPLDLVPCHIPEVPPEAPFNLPFKWISLWNKCREEIRDYIVMLAKKRPKGWPRCLLAFLFWQIGWDCGVTMRSLQRNGRITWGRFTDEEERVHFHVHPNSFVVLPPDMVEDHLLAPLNFDLAYTGASYESEGKGDPEENFEMELNFLRLVLSGGDIRTSEKGPEVSPEFRVQTVSVGMRDTLLAGFDTAFAGNPNPHPFLPELQGAVVAVTQVALMLAAL